MANGAGIGALMGMSFGVMLVAIVVGIIVGTLILMLATRIVEKFTPSFGRALVTQIAVEDQVVGRAEGVRQGPGQAAHDGHDPARVGLVDGHEYAHRAGT